MNVRLIEHFVTAPELKDIELGRQRYVLLNDPHVGAGDGVALRTHGRANPDLHLVKSVLHLKDRDNELLGFLKDVPGMDPALDASTFEDGTLVCIDQASIPLSMLFKDE